MMPVEPLPEISIVVPVYFGAETIEELHERLVRVMTGMGRPFEIIMVDDGSEDASWATIRRLVEKDRRVQGLRLMRNYGQSNATVAGLMRARGNLLLTIDDDLQNPPEEIPKLIGAMEEDPDLDVVIGAPREKQHASWRNLASGLLNSVSNRIFTRARSFKLTSFRLMRRGVVEPLFDLNMPLHVPGAQLGRITQRIANVSVEHAPRTQGRSRYTFRKMFGLTINKLLGFSVFPLRFLAIMGVIGVVASFILGVVYLVLWLSGAVRVPGFITQILFLVMLSGFNFLAFGILGEYLQQILLSARNTPAFIVREHAGRPADRDLGGREPTRLEWEAPEESGP